MSDVSGIPNMGFGGGNFFAPQFSYNPQMSAGQASAAYMPEIGYSQNVVNNLYGGGANAGYGRQTDYYSALGASYGRQIQSSEDNPYRYGGVPASLAYPGASLSGGYTTGAANMPSYDTGPNFGFTSGGMGTIDLSRNQFSGGGSGGGYNAPTIDWSGVGQAAGGMGGGRQDPYPNMSMPGGLNSPFSSPSGAQPFDWGGLFGGGGERTSGIAPDTTGGRDFGGAPQTQSQPGINWNNVGAAAGGSAPYTSGIAPDLSGGQTVAGGAASDPYPNMAMPGGLNSPMSAPEPGASFGERFDAVGGSAPTGTRTYDFKPMFEAGGGGGFGSGGTESQTFGSNAGSLGGNPFSYIQSGEVPVQAQGSDKSASTLAAEARARLADIIGSPETAKAVEKAGEIQSPANDYSKFQQPGKAPLSDLSNLPPEFPDYTKLYPEYRGGAPASAEPATDRLGRPLIPEENPPRPSEDVFPAARLAPNGKEPELFVVHHTGPSGGTPESIVEGWRSDPSPSRRNVVGSQYIMDRNGVIHDTANEYGYTAINHAKDFNIPGTGISKDQGTSNRSIVGMEIIAKDEKDVTPAQQAALVRFANERYPDTPFYGHGEISGNRMNNEGIPGAQAVLASRPAPFNFDWSNAPIPGPPNGPPTQPLPEGASRPPADVGTPFVNDGTPFGPPAPADYTPPAAAPVKHSGLELARANIDTPIEKIAMERGGQKAVDQVSSMAVGMTPRQLLASYGGLFMSKAEPLFASLGITRQDFDKAVTMPPTRQDIKMRFGEGDIFGPYPAYTGPEAAPSGGNDVYSQFRQSANVEDRRDEQFMPEQQGPADTAPGAAPVPGFFGNDENIANRKLMPGELSANWNRNIYEATDRPTMARDESLGPDPNPFTGFRPSENVDDRRFDPELTDEQKKTFQGGLPQHQYQLTQEQLDEAATAGRTTLAKQLGADQIGNLEANATMRGATQGARAPRAGDFGENDGTGPVGPTSSAFDLSPGGFGEGGYGNTFRLPEQSSSAAMEGPPNPFAPHPYMTAVLGDEGTARQKGMLQEQRSPYAQQIEANPELAKKVLAVGIAELGENNPRDVAQLYETLFNRGAAHGIQGLEDPTLLNSDHYATLRPASKDALAEAYRKLDNPEFFNRQMSVLQEVLAGSNVSGLATTNVSGGGSNEKFLRDELASQMVGGTSYGAGTKEFFTTKDVNEAVNGRDFVNQERQWYDSLMPPRGGR